MRILAVGVLALVPAVVIPGVAAAASGVDFSATEGQSFTKRVAAISGCTLSGAAINWGDGQPASVGESDSTGGVPGVKGTHTYGEAGVYNGTVSYTCSESSGTHTVSFQGTVRDAPLVASGLNVAGTAGQSLTGAVAHFTDADPGGLASDFSAQIAWGDGGTTPGTVTAAPGGGFDVAGTHTYSGTGNYPISTTISDVDGSSTNAGSSATIAAVTAPGGPGLPKASFTYFPASPCRGQDMIFDASASTSGTPIVQYRWTFAGVTAHPRPRSPGVLDLDPPAVVGPTSSDRLSRAFGIFYLPPYVGYAVIRRPPVQASLEVTDSSGRKASVTQTISFLNPVSTWISAPVDEPPCSTRTWFAYAAVSQVATLSGGSVYTALRCQGPVDCAGALSVATSARGSRGASGAARRRRSRSRTLGRAGFAVQAGRKAAVRVRLNRRGRALARAGRLRKLSLREKVRGRNGKSIVRSRSVRLRRRR
jgi:hypothetical protein